MGKIWVDDKIKNGQYPFKNQPSSIPLFHYSIFETSVQARLPLQGTSGQASKNVLFFH
jgi:hypothetical protein